MSAAVITSTVFFLAWIASEIGVREKRTEVDMDQTRSTILQGGASHCGEDGRNTRPQNMPTATT